MERKAGLITNVTSSINNDTSTTLLEFAVSGTGNLMFHQNLMGGNITYPAYTNSSSGVVMGCDYLGVCTAPQLVNTTTPIRDETRFVLAANMTAVDTAGVKIGSTGSGNSTFSWPVTAANWYDLQCKLPVTFVSSATIAFELVSISGSVTIAEVNAETLGDTGASAAFQDLATIAGTSLAGSVTPTTGAPGGVSETITYNAQFLTSHAENIGLEFVGNAANNVQPLLGGECSLTQIN